MKFTTGDLNWAVEEDIITSEVRDSLVSALVKRQEQTPSLAFTNVLYYLGGLIVIGAMSFYLSVAWESLSAGSLLGIALSYAAVLLFAGNWLWGRGQRIPGGILVAAAVCMTPMVVYALQSMLGLWGGDNPGEYRDFFHWIKSGWAVMEVATVLAGLLAIRFYRFPFITMPIAFTLWFFSMDLVAVLYGGDFSWEDRAQVSLWFGLVMLVATYLIDRRTREDFAFWGYLFGMLAFWGGLTSQDSNSELAKFGYCMINVLLIFLSPLLQRRVFIVFGSLGVSGYIGHLARSVFKDDLIFTFVLSGLGLLIIGLGLLYHRYQVQIESRMKSLLPEVLRRTLPQYR